MTEKNYGLSGFGVTSSFCMFNPEAVFELTDALNQALPPEDFLPIELYPARFFVTPDKVFNLLDKYPNTRVDRVHLEFAYSEIEKWHQIILGNFHKGSWGGFGSRLIHLGLYQLIGAASGGYGLNLAKELGCGVNVHTNVLEGFSRDKKLTQLKEGARFVLAENSINYNCPVVSGPILYDPDVVVREQVEKYGLDGLLLAVDHLLDYFDVQQIDPVKKLRSQRVRSRTKAMHISQKGHGLIKAGDPTLAPFFGELGQTPFENPVRAFFDYSPEVLKMPFGERVKHFRETMDWIQSFKR